MTTAIETATTNTLPSEIPLLVLMTCVEDQGEETFICGTDTQTVNSADDFMSVLWAEQTDEFDAWIYGKTTAAQGIQNFAEDAAGTTLRQLISGIAYKSGDVSVDFDDLLEECWEQELYRGDDAQDAAILEAADRYVLQADGTFKLMN